MASTDGHGPPAGTSSFSGSESPRDPLFMSMQLALQEVIAGELQGLFLPMQLLPHKLSDSQGRTFVMLLSHDSRPGCGRSTSSSSWHLFSSQQEKVAGRCKPSMFLTIVRVHRMNTRLSA